MNQGQVLTALNKYLQQNGTNTTAMDDWVITPYKDAFVFASADGLRSNSLHMVRADKVKSFSLVIETTEDAYSSLA